MKAEASFCLVVRVAPLQLDRFIATAGQGVLPSANRARTLDLFAWRLLHRRRLPEKPHYQGVLA